MNQDNGPTMPIPGMAGSLATCGTCKFGVSVGLDKPLECHWDVPHVGVFLVQDSKGNPQTINASKYPDVKRTDQGCSHHTAKVL